MMKFLVLFFVLSSAHAYVPTVESLFRHGSNPDISGNGMNITFVVKRMEAINKDKSQSQDISLISDAKVEDYYKLFFTKSGDILKLAQTRYADPTFSEGSLLHKTYYPNFSSYTIKPSLEFSEKGIFFGVMSSLLQNNGAHLLNYLKSLGVPVKLNNEIINREKVEFLADYKKYLVVISKDRNARKTEMNPMRPEDATARERADEIMSQPMYIDTKQVNLAKNEGEIAWVVNAGSFEAVFSYRERNLQKLTYKTTAGEFEIVFKDYWLANGTHSLPRYMLIKGFNGQQYQVEITNLRHYIEREDDLVKRLKNWDQALKGKDSTLTRPEFLL